MTTEDRMLLYSFLKQIKIGHISTSATCWQIKDIVFIFPTPRKIINFIQKDSYLRIVLFCQNILVFQKLTYVLQSWWDMEVKWSSRCVLLLLVAQKEQFMGIRGRRFLRRTVPRQSANTELVASITVKAAPLAVAADSMATSGHWHHLSTIVTLVREMRWESDAERRRGKGAWEVNSFWPTDLFLTQIAELSVCKIQSSWRKNATCTIKIWICIFLYIFISKCIPSFSNIIFSKRIPKKEI